jgi:Tol biopolymer transport system component
MVTPSMRRQRLSIATVVVALLTLVVPAAFAAAASAIPGRFARPARPAAGTSSDIYTINLVTRRVRKITNANYGAYYDGPTWSPGGDRIAFAGSPCDDCPDLDSRLYVVSLPARAITPIDVSVAPATRPSWSPRGDVLVFIGDVQAAVYRVRIDGTGLVSIVGGAAHDDAVWSPDGRRIAYTRQQANGKWDIYVTDVARHTERALTHTAASEEQPAWSPDGKRIAFARQGSNGTWSLYVMNANGGTAHRIGPRWGASSENPAWSPDGRKLAFVAVTPSKAAVFVMNADGTAAQRVPTRTPRSYDPVWAPDGGMLAYVGSG